MVVIYLHFDVVWRASLLLIGENYNNIRDETLIAVVTHCELYHGGKKVCPVVQIG